MVRLIFIFSDPKDTILFLFIIINSNSISYIYIKRINIIFKVDRNHITYSVNSLIFLEKSLFPHFRNTTRRDGETAVPKDTAMSFCTIHRMQNITNGNRSHRTRCTRRHVFIAGNNQPDRIAAPSILFKVVIMR